MDRKQRLALFFAALEAAPAASDRASARELLAVILNAIEDAHSGATYDPANWMTDGRIYPPQADYKQDGTYDGVDLFHTQGHRIWFADNGAIRIEVRKGPDRGRIDLEKFGSDGRPCPTFD